MTDSKKGLLAGALLGDALSLGAHWIYDTNEIKKTFGEIDGFTDPKKNPYHSMKNIGDLTHYGDQMMILISSIAEQGGYNPEAYRESWKETMKNYTGYMDHATKVTLEKGSGSDSFDGSAIGRIAPLLAMDTVATDESITEFINFTHNHETVKSGALFIAHAIQGIQTGKSPTQAIQETTSDSSDILRFRDEAVASISEETLTAIKKFSQSCGIDGVFQGALHCIMKYKGDFRLALIENTRAGGDSAARGMIIGMVLGASLGYEKLPKDWLGTMNIKV